MVLFNFWRYSRSYWALSSLSLAGWMLASCGVGPDNGASGGGGKSPGASGDGTANTCTQVQLAESAVTVLKNSCYSCHGSSGVSKGGPSDVSQLAALVNSGMVVAFDAAHSPLLLAITSGKMPPSGKAAPSAADMLNLNNWVAAGAPTFAAADLPALAAKCSASGAGTASPSGAAPSPGAAPTPAPAPSAPSPSTAGPVQPTPPNPTTASSPTPPGPTTPSSPTPPAPPAPQGPALPPAQAAALAQSAQAVLSTYCAACHSGGNSSGGLGSITDLSHLIAAGIVVPGDLSQSKLYARLINGTSPMPPAGRAAPTTGDIATIATWILAGAPTNTVPTPTTVTVLSPTEVFTLVAQDLQTVAAQSNGNARFTRYISFAHLVAAGATSADLADYANGLSRLLNSLSTNPRLTKPVAINLDGSIFRFDLRDYNWSRDNWETLLGRYPYLAAQRSASLASAFQLQARTQLPVVNGDWFSFTAAQPPLYDLLLGLGNDEASLEKQLQFNIVNDLIDTLQDSANTDTQVLRAGFARSGVALNNRAFDRYQTQNGGYWRSYDFADPGLNSSASQLAAKSVFASPLGSARLINTSTAFSEDAGEIIFSLPNGLQGYYIVDAQAQRLDVAALNVALDPSRQQKSIITGYSCMGCHAHGLLPKADEVAAAAAGRGFSADELTLINRLYGNRTAMSSALQNDTTRYLSALAAASFDPQNTKPMVLAGNFYEVEVNLAAAAATLGLTPPEFLNLLSNAGVTVKESLAPLASGSTVAREVFEALFPQLVADFFGIIPAP